MGYFVALGNIAGAKSDTNAYGIQDFAKTLIASKQYGSNEAITESAGLLSSAIDEFFNAKKRNAISQFAGSEGEKFIRTASPGLLNASQVLDQSLGEEEDAINDFYIENFKHTKGGTDMLSALQYRQEWAGDLKTIQDRRDAIVSYDRAIADLNRAHGSLVESIRTNDPRAVASVVQLYISEFGPLVDKMNAAYK